jgi:hypothetical protein
MSGKHWTVFALVVVLSGSAAALEPITYSGREALTSGNAANSSGAADADCEALAREVEALKGQPLRRAAAEERYQAQCQEQPPAPIDVPPLQ